MAAFVLICCPVFSFFMNKLFIISPIWTKYLLASLQYNISVTSRCAYAWSKRGAEHILTSRYIFINANLIVKTGACTFWGMHARFINEAPESQLTPCSSKGLLLNSVGREEA